MKKPVFSVIMPCYNSQDYVCKAIESVIQQTYADIELIIINDGSNDDTLKIVNSYVEKDKRIKVYSKKNGGYATAVNMGLDKINGDYFCFIGSDDCFDKALFENIYLNICKVGELPDFIAFRTFIYIDNLPKGIDRYTDFDTVGYLNKTKIKEFNNKYPKHARIFSIRDTSKLYKTSLLKDLRYFGKTGFDADGIFSMIFSHRATSFLSIPYDGYLWNMRKNSVSSTVSIQKNLDRINSWRSFCEELLKMDLNEVTSIEKDYSTFGMHILKEISEKWSSAFKYYRFIKENTKFFLKSLAVFSPDVITVGMKTLAISPVLYCLLNKIKKIKN